MTVGDMLKYLEQYPRDTPMVREIHDHSYSSVSVERRTLQPESYMSWSDPSYIPEDPTQTCVVIF